MTHLVLSIGRCIHEQEKIKQLKQSKDVYSETLIESLS